MKRWFWWSIPVLILISGVALSDDDEEEHGAKHWWRKVASDIRPVENTLYKEECASCHMAYQPGLLPAASWKKIMANLEEHFGENAELDAETLKQLSAYLEENAADKDGYGRSAAFARNRGAVPMRITETRYFLRKHDEVPNRFLKHKQIGSFSNCAACHRSADRGIYDEHDINIPGVGSWDD